MRLKRKIADQLVLAASRELADALGSCAATADAAATCAAGGHRAEAMRILLDMDVTLHEAQRLLELASFVHRKAGVRSEE